MIMQGGATLWKRAQLWKRIKTETEDETQKRKEFGFECWLGKKKNHVEGGRGYNKWEAAGLLF